MKRIILVIFLSLISRYFAFSQISMGVFGFSGTYYDIGNSIIQANDGGYAIAGVTRIGATTDKVYIIKLDTNYTITWSKVIGGTGSERGNSIIQTIDNGYMVVGYTSSYGAGGNDIYVIKLDSLGNIKWTGTYGGTGDDEGTSIVSAGNGKYVIAGFTNSYGTGGYDAYIIEIDGSGNLLLTKTFGNLSDEKINSIYRTKDKGYILAGYTNSSGAGGQDAYFLKLDSIFNFTWATTVGGGNNEVGSSVIQTSYGNYAMAGYSDSTAGPGVISLYSVLLDSTGNLTKAESIGAHNVEEGNAIIETTDGNLALTGYSYSFSVDGTGDVYALKLDTALNIKQTATIGGCGGNGQSIIQTKDKGFVTVGTNCTDSGGNIFLVKFDSNLTTCQKTGHGGHINKFGIQGNPIVYMGSGGMLSSTDSGKVWSGGTISKMCGSLTSINNLVSPVYKIQISPNPSTGKFTIQSPVVSGRSLVEVYNLLGEKVYSQSPIVNSQFSINLTNQPSGIYLYRITTEKGELVGSGKLVIE